MLLCLVRMDEDDYRSVMRKVRAFCQQSFALLVGNSLLASSV